MEKMLTLRLESDGVTNSSLTEGDGLANAHRTKASISTSTQKVQISATE